jgi:D-lyxose ketol-isomerase
VALTRKQWEEARNRALAYYEKVSIALTDQEKETMEIADFGLGNLDQIGLELITYVNTERCCAKELVLFPWQICPEHRHPQVKGYPGKEETFRCRWGEVYLYVEGTATPNAKAKVPQDRKEYFTVRHEVILRPGEQFTLQPNTLHWFQAGPDGAVISEFSTKSIDEEDIFTDPNIRRTPIVE